MSADNWAICPECEKRNILANQKQTDDIANQYGVSGFNPSTITSSGVSNVSGGSAKVNKLNVKRKIKNIVYFFIINPPRILLIFFLDLQILRSILFVKLNSGWCGLHSFN